MGIELCRVLRELSGYLFLISVEGVKYIRRGIKGAELCYSHEGADVRSRRDSAILAWRTICLFFFFLPLLLLLLLALLLVLLVLCLLLLLLLLRLLLLLADSRRVD